MGKIYAVEREPIRRNQFNHIDAKTEGVTTFDRTDAARARAG
jgi:hypothetical protein